MSLVIQSIESGEERIVPMTPSPVGLNWAVMFPDGLSVLVDSTRPRDGRGLFREDAASGAWIWLKKTGERELVGSPWGISPDGRTIYLNRWPNDGLVHLIAGEIETGQERKLRKGKGPVPVGLSPDGQQLAVSYADGNDLVIEVLPAAGGAKREVCRLPGLKGTSRADVNSELTWTPDGRSLIFVDKTGNSDRLVRVSVQGGETQPVGLSAASGEEAQFQHCFGAIRTHPNGRQLVYVANGPSAGAEVWALKNFLPKPAK